MLLISIACLFAGCNGEGNPSPQPSVVTVSVYTQSEYYSDGRFYISDSETDSFEYSRLFVVLRDGKSVQPSITTTQPDANGEFTVTASYGDKSATATVVIVKTVYELNISLESVSVIPAQALEYDYLSLFSATANGQPVAITDDMVTSNVKAERGTYAYTVSFHGITRTVTVNVADVVEVTALKSSLTLESKDIDDYDFASLFKVTVNGKDIIVKGSMLDKSQLPLEGGSGKIGCVWQGASAYVNVTVKPNNIVIAVRKSTVTLNAQRVDDYDFAALFVLTVDGIAQTVEPSMLDSDVQASAGEYTVTLRRAAASASVRVIVAEHPVAQAICNYSTYRLSAEQVADFDYTRLFALYLDEQAVRVTADMVDASAVRAENGTYTVTLTYVYEDNTAYTATAQVEVGLPTVSLTAQNTVVYPNSDPIDLTTLFAIEDDGEAIAVTDDMLDGEVNYSVAGEYQITLDYNGYTTVAVVEVKTGVVIVAAAQTVEIKAGTSKAQYDFSNDFKVIVNGVRLTNIDQYVGGLDDADFDTIGAESVITVSVPYCSKAAGLGGSVEFETTTASITYRAVKNTAEIKLLADSVRLDAGTTSYDPLTNLKVYLNGGYLPVTLTNRRDYADSITCYVDADAVDFSLDEPQLITARVYVNGTDAPPVIVQFYVTLADKTVVEATDKVIFTESTLYTAGLFTATVNGAAVEVTQDMVQGRVDVFTPGTYSVKATLNGVTATARVVVLDKRLAGTYKTTITEVNDTSDNAGGRAYGELIIRTDGTLTVDNREGYVAAAIDQSHLVVNVYSSTYQAVTYDLYYNDGIVVLAADNTVKLAFTNARRPLVYFSTSQWDIQSSFKLNTLSTHVLEQTTSGWTMEVFRLKGEARSMWYALKIRLKEKTAADTVYDVSWGEVEFSEGFAQQQDEQAMVIFEGEKTLFRMLGPLVGQTVKSDELERKLAGKTFSGSLDGNSAMLIFNSYEGAKLVSGGTTVFDLTYNEISAMKNGGANYDENTFFVYRCKIDGNEPQYYSYFFKLNPSNNTFTVAAKDVAYGYYLGDDSYIYLDGYGTGEVNFNVSSGYYSYVTRITYTIDGSSVHVKFVDASSSFEQGTEATFYLSELLNVLTARRISDDSLVGKQFVNQKIADGAIVTIGALTTGKVSGSSANQTAALERLLESITVITKDGEWTTEQKKNGIDTKAVKLNKAGVYRITITVSVGGTTVSSDYAVQVLDSVYSGNAVVAYYVGVLGSDDTVKLDEFGLATANINGTAYTGTFMPEQGGFVARLTGTSGKLTLIGKPVAEGVFEATYSGAASGKTVLSKGTNRTSGTSGSYLTEVVCNGVTTHLFGNKVNYSAVQLTLVEGDSLRNNGILVTFTALGVDYAVRVDDWKNASDGLTFADANRGEYSDADGNTLVVDGFGTLTLNGSSAAYVVNANGTLYAVVDGNPTVLTLSGTAFTTATAPTAEQMLDGKTFTAQYKFSCGYLGYEATTSFAFVDGTVVCTSVCPDHDEGDYACEDDVYACPIGNSTGMDGTYTASGNTVTVTIGEYTFTFELNDYADATAIICTSTSLASSDHGYFKVGVAFTVA